MKFRGIAQQIGFILQCKREVIQSIDASTIYEVPNLMLEEGLDVVALKKLDLPKKQLQI
jgi:CTP synthase